MANLMGPPRPNSLIEQILGGQMPYNTPGINPAAPPVNTPSAPTGGANGGFFSQPSFLMNLLAQSGYSTMPQSPLGAIGRAGLMTQQQNQMQQMTQLQRQLLESQIGLNRARAQGAAAPNAGEPLTAMAKLRADFEAGRIGSDVYQAERGKLLRQAQNEGFDNTRALRGEFGEATKQTRQSLQSLSAAASLLETSQNPIADLAGFISTIKSIDNSTVREGELAAFNSIQGLTRSLENLFSQAQGKGFTPELRRDIAETINKLREPLARHYAAQQKFFQEEAERFGIDRVSVTGAGVLDSGEIDLSRFGAAPPPVSAPPAVSQDDEVDAEL